MPPTEACPSSRWPFSAPPPCRWPGTACAIDETTRLHGLGASIPSRVMANSVVKNGIGAPLRRLEDARLLLGEGAYSDDFTLPGQTRGVMLRSPHAHARIVSVDASAAQKMPGVLLVLTGADVLAEGLQPIPHIPQAMSPPDIRLDNLDGSPHLLERPMILATDSVRFVGEGVAFVVADTVAQARDAAEALSVGYESLPPMSDIAVDARVGNPAATRAGF